MSRQITIPVKLDEKTFKRFSRFDMFRLRKRWVRPVVFALILIAFAAVALLTGKAQAGMIASVLLVVGLGLPLVYFGSFLSQVNVQAAQRGLGKGRPVYTVCLDFDGITVTNKLKEEPPVTVKWKDAQAAFKAKGCVYLYVSAVRAFLLPDGQADAGDDALWAYIEEHMGAKAKKLYK
ncbi:MAG: YcxB family protein [Clostridia bacterium]|nr:YcxB family protein [Clostridia bacterium]